MMWLVEPMKKRPLIDQKINELFTVQQNSDATNRDFLVNSQNVVHLLFFFSIGEKNDVHNKIIYCMI